MTAAQAREIEKLLGRIGKLEAEVETKNGVISGLADDRATATRALGHVVENCYCRPSGQTCDACQPAVLALIALGAP